MLHNQFMVYRTLSSDVVITQFTLSFMIFKYIQGPKTDHSKYSGCIEAVLEQKVPAVNF